ncbi:MAG TPA: Gfo/Idh/MocA family oxidoreductase [Vicinamibacterales bacterium]|nr:Gfo/Idh/MocA family oxidoreductase [Vicinamibacterales bacterium]HPK72009.1 Gfo/Idh/MocA family oxidoreductase [Vicinamibacterales bacterium]
MPSEMNRREFLSGAAAAAASFTIVPRRVLGGAGFVAPSDKITLACIGFGTQAIREIGGILASPDVEVVAVCDVDKTGVGYLEWGKDQIRNDIRRIIDEPTWRENVKGVPGGLDVGKEIVDTYYRKQRGAAPGAKGCAAYVDYRELLEQEKDVTAVKVLTPDHTHAPIAIAALRRGMNVIVHKPLANRVLEARAVIEAARAANKATHFLPASEGASQRQALEMIGNGAIGTLREIHNWSARPMWPQFPTLPADTPPVPAGFDWTLWLGPSLDRPYHPNYTHTNFRGWYEFGGGSIADMGHYSLWPIFQALELDAPLSVESTPSHVCAVADDICYTIKNDYSFPAACTVRMRFGAKRARPGLDIFWYDGGIRPPVPEELMAENKELPSEGMLFVGDTGKILGGFRAENPQIVPEAKMRAYRAAHNIPEPAPPQPRQRGPQDLRPRPSERDLAWINAFKGGPRSYGDFLLAQPICDAVNLAAVSLRLGGRRLLWDAAAARVTNVPEANALLTREYRPGWQI